MGFMEDPATSEAIRANLRFYSDYGLRARHIANRNACPTCRGLDGREYDPKKAPRIPVTGCTNDVCRCEYSPGKSTTIRDYLWDRLEGFGIVMLVLPVLVVVLELLIGAPQVELPRDFFLSLPFAAFGALIVWFARRRRSN